MLKKPYKKIDNCSIYGNNHNIPLIYWYELTESEKSEFDYMENPDDNFTGFRYKGNVYSLSDFMRIEKNNSFYDHFHGMLSDTYFSGILVKFNDEDSDFIKAYTFFCA